MLPGHIQTLSMGGEGNRAVIPSKLDTQGGISCISDGAQPGRAGCESAQEQRPLALHPCPFSSSSFPFSLPSLCGFSVLFSC